MSSHRVAAIRAAVILLCLISSIHAQDETGKPAQGPPALPTGNPLTATQPAEGVNLMVNSGFEEPNEKGDGPRHWQQVDHLVWFWSNDPAAPERGKVLKIDTDVDQRQAYDWWIDHFLKGQPLSKAPVKTPNGVPGYGTIAGLDGGFYWSGFIPIKPGRAYKVYVDAKGPVSKVFIRGYEKEVPLTFADEAPAVQQLFRQARGEPEFDAKGHAVKYRLRYRYQTWFAVGGTNQWATYTHGKPRDPTGRELTENVRFIRIVLYPYWPQGTYWYDNIRVYEVDPLPNQHRPEGDAADFEEGKIIR